jgi:hypothetical protein
MESMTLTLRSKRDALTIAGLSASANCSSIRKTGVMQRFLFWSRHVKRAKQGPNSQ